MKKVYQRIIDPGIGDCMQCVIASLFNMKYEDVPAFITMKDGWFNALYQLSQSKGYDYEGMLHNRNYNRLWHPTASCFKKEEWHYPQIMTKKKLYKESGVNGLFYAAVLSPKYFNFNEGKNVTHAVIIDRDYNIVHDPNPGYKNILGYPLREILGYNGIIDVFLINKLNNEKN